MLRFLYLFGPGAVAWLVQKWFSSDEENSSRLSPLLEVLAYTVLITEVTVVSLLPLDRVKLATAKDGGLIVNYGTTALALSMLLALFLGIVGANIRGWGLKRFRKFVMISGAIALACGGALLIFWRTSGPGVTAQVSTKPLKINNEFYDATVPLYVDHNNEYFIQARALAAGLGNSFQVRESGLFEISCKSGDREFVANRLKNGSGYFMKDGELFVSFSVLEETLGLNVIDNAVLADGSERQVIYIDNFPQRFDYEWTKNAYIAHALGGVDGVTYTNSLEAFEANYNAGFRVFEVDLRLTADGALAAVHDAPEHEDGSLMTLEEYKATKIQGQYTPLSFEDVLMLMKQYPDIYIITDTKKKDKELLRQQFTLIVETADRVAPEALDRIIPQLYNEHTFDLIMSFYDWKSIVYTMYALKEFSEKEVIDFAYRQGIQVITTSKSKSQQSFFDQLYERGIQVYMHTYNTPEEMQELTARGVTGVYTDFLVPGQE